MNRYYVTLIRDVGIAVIISVTFLLEYFVSGLNIEVLNRKNIGTNDTSPIVKSLENKSYYYNSATDKMEETLVWLRYSRTFNDNGEEVRTDHPTSMEELLSSMNTNIGERTCTIDADLAVEVEEFNTETNGDVVTVNLKIKSKLPIDIKYLKFTGVFHDSKRVYFDTKFEMDLSQNEEYLKAYDTIVLTSEVKIDTDNIELIKNAKLSIVEGFIR